MTHPLNAQQPFETYATHADGSVCTCVYSSAQWWLKHWTLAQIAPSQLAWLAELEATLKACGMVEANP